MKHIVGCLILSSLGSLNSLASAGNLNVTQCPREVTVNEGGSAQIHCCWNKDAKRVNVYWTKNKTPFDSKVINGQCNAKDLYPAACNCSNLTLSNITVNDSGLYICEVIIDKPVLFQSEGNGTNITVNITNGNEENNHPPNPFPIIPLAALPVLCVLFLAGLSCCLYRKHVLASENVARVIYETPHCGSETDDQSTTSSRGSTQWCQVKVYESVDYFAVEKNTGMG